MVRFTLALTLLLAAAANAKTYCQCLFNDGSHCCVTVSLSPPDLENNEGRRLTPVSTCDSPRNRTRTARPAACTNSSIMTPRPSVMLAASGRRSALGTHRVAWFALDFRHYCRQPDASYAALCRHVTRQREKEY